MATFIPNGDCPYYHGDKGDASQPCLMCGKSARQHGSLFTTADVTRKFDQLLAYAVKLDQQLCQGNYPPGSCIDALRGILEPTPPLPLTLPDAPPFETPTIDVMLRHFLRYAYPTPAQARPAQPGQPPQPPQQASSDPIREAGRKACALLMKMIDSPGFYNTVLASLAAPGAEKAVDTILFKDFFERWRRWCHECPVARVKPPGADAAVASTAPDGTADVAGQEGVKPAAVEGNVAAAAAAVDTVRPQCEFCRANPGRSLMVQSQDGRMELRKASASFGVQFLQHLWDSIKHHVNGKEVYQSQRVPPEIRAAIPAILQGLEREMKYPTSSVIFHKHATVRMAFLVALSGSQAFNPTAPRPALASYPPVPPQQLRHSGSNVSLHHLAAPQHYVPPSAATVAALAPSIKKLKGAEAREALEKGDSFLIKVVTDCRDKNGWELLIGLKEVISMQLPEMPKYYIMRALFDGHHESLCVLREGKVVGGCTFRPFVKQEFVEIVFLVVNPNTLNKGLGSLIMTEVKAYVHGALGLSYLLTYADNTAIDFFKKQGFTKDVSLSRTKWAGYIKDYTKATLMEYHIAPVRDAGVAQQAQWVKLCINSKLADAPVHDGLPKSTRFPVKPKSVPGVESDSHLDSRMARILQRVKRSRYVGPFLKVRVCVSGLSHSL